MIVLEESVDLETPSGPMRNWIHRPAAPGRYPAVLMFSEIFQRTGPIARTATWLAGHGYLVAVPEIYHELEAPGTVLPYDPAGTERGNRNKVAKPVSAYDADARAALAFLACSPHSTGRLGALGICIGGHLALRAAMQAGVRATACFYPTDVHKGSLGLGGDGTLDELGAVEGELLLLWGRQDPHIPVEGRELIHRRLTELGLTFTWHELNGAHAFVRDEGPRYDPELATLGLGLVLALFHRRLGGPELPEAAGPAVGAAGGANAKC